MKKRILVGLGLLATAGIIYTITRSGPGSPPEPGAATPHAKAPASTPGLAPVTSGTDPAEPISEFDRSPSVSPPGANDEGASGAVMPDPRVSRVDGKVYLNDSITLTRRMHTENTTPMDDVGAVGNALRYYQLVYKENPFGSLNEEIVNQLTGDNPKNIVVIPPDHPDLNDKGELLDRWGTPYFFHGLTRTAMDVWSAGPDRNFGSADDVKLGLDEEYGKQLGIMLDP